MTSKGAAGVTGSGFIGLAATLSSIGTILVEGIMLVFGMGKFMSACRALTNVCGNSVVSIFVSKWEGRGSPSMPVRSWIARRTTWRS